MHTEKRASEDRGRDSNYKVGMASIVGSHQKPGRSRKPSRRQCSCQHLVFGLPAFRIVKE